MTSQDRYIDLSFLATGSSKRDGMRVLNAALPYRYSCKLGLDVTDCLSTRKYANDSNPKIGQRGINIDKNVKKEMFTKGDDTKNVRSHRRENFGQS